MTQTPKAAIPAEINNESALSICVPFQRLARQERWLVAGQLQDSAPAVVAISFDRVEKAATAGTGCAERVPSPVQSGSCHKRKSPLHSITASGRVSNVAGMIRSSVLAVLRLTANSNLIGCSIGRSLAFVS